MTVTRRTRSLALVLTILGGAVAVVTLACIGVASYAPWRFVAFIPLEQPRRSAPVVTAGVIMLGVAGWLGLQNRTAAKATTALATITAFMVLCVGSVAVVGNEIDEIVMGELVALRHVAVSLDGRFELIAQHMSSDQLHYRLRTSGRLLGREGKTDLACTAVEPTRTDYSKHDRYSAQVPSVLVEHARFVDGSHVELRMTDDGRIWRVRFNAWSLRPERFLNWCDPVKDQPQ
jgi:hypothetical protein